MVKYLWNGIVSTIVTFVTLWHDVTGSGSYQGLFNSTITWSYYFGHMIKIILFDNLIFYFQEITVSAAYQSPKAVKTDCVERLVQLRSAW